MRAFLSPLFVGILSSACLPTAPEQATDCERVEIPQVPAAPVRVFDYDATAPLELETELVQEALATTIYHVRFRGQYGAAVTGRMFVPGGDAPKPAIVLMHGLPGSAIGMTAAGMQLADHGAVVLAVDAPWVGRDGPVLTLTAQDSADQVRLIVSLRRAVDLLAQRPDVDAQRIGYFGYSYGAAMGALVAGVEPRLRTAILAVGDGGLVSHLTGPDDPSCAPPGRPPEQWERWLRAMWPIEPIRFVGRADMMPILFQGALQDELVPVRDHQAVVAAAGPGARSRWYTSGHDLNLLADRDRLEWFAQHLGTAAPGP